MKVKRLSLGVLGTNCYIISKDNKALIVDPSGEATVIESYLEKNKLTLEAIFLTHAHFDHIGAVDDIRSKYAIDVYLHEAEKDWLEDGNLNRSKIHFGEQGKIISAHPEHYLPDGKYELGNFSFEVMHTPGHSPGSVTFVFHDEKFIVSGDVLFQSGIGRTDLPGGSMGELAKSITEKLYTLPDDFIVYPGHGDATNIHTEKSTNPYTLQFYQA